MPVFLFMLVCKSNLISWVYFRRNLLWEWWDVFSFMRSPWVLDACLFLECGSTKVCGSSVFQPNGASFLAWQHWWERLPHPHYQFQNMMASAMAISLLVGKKELSSLTRTISSIGHRRFWPALERETEAWRVRVEQKQQSFDISSWFFFPMIQKMLQTRKHQEFREASPRSSWWENAGIHGLSPSMQNIQTLLAHVLVRLLQISYLDTGEWNANVSLLMWIITEEATLGLPRFKTGNVRLLTFRKRLKFASELV